MNVDYPGAIPMWVPENDLFTTNTHQSIVIHKTANGTTPQEIAQYFINVSPGPSVHYIVGLDGTIVQSAPESMGSGGNCCLEQGHDPFWDQFGTINLNTVTLSVEHVDPSPTNSTPCPQAQVDASFKLVLYLASKYHIAPDHIKPHSSLDPSHWSHCPGAYPFTDLINYVQNGGGSMTPMGWTDDGQTLRSPNGVPIVHGFRAFVLANNWHQDNWALAAEQGVTLLEASNPSLGGGDQQVFRWSLLGYTVARGVFMEWTGQELAFVRGQLATYYPQVKVLQAEVDSLKQQLATAQQPTGLDPAKVATFQQSIEISLKQAAQSVAQAETLAAQPIS